MCVFQASPFKVHATMRRDLPMSTVFFQISFALGGTYFALGGTYFALGGAYFALGGAYFALGGVFFLQ
jgi:hypothetical protein